MKQPLTCAAGVLPELRLSEAVHVKSAELWLKLGQPDEALSELQQLPTSSRDHPWAVKVTQKACRIAASRVRLFL